jgi:hypothetical protein
MKCKNWLCFGFEKGFCYPAKWAECSTPDQYMNKCKQRKAFNRLERARTSKEGNSFMAQWYKENLKGGE